MDCATAELLEGSPHKFRTARVSPGTLCKLCHQAISFGLPRSAHQCTVCESVCHKKCSASMPSNCVAITPKALQRRTAKSEVVMTRDTISQQWKKRWCVLTKDFVLYIFKDLNSPAPLAVIHLVNYNRADAWGDKKNGFELSNTEAASEYPPILFQGDSPQQTKEWVEALQQVLREKKAFGVTRSLMTSQLLTTNQEEEGDLIRLYRRIYCKVVQARDLPAMDIIGTSDPYVRLIVDSQQVRSSTQWRNNKSPFWGQDFVFKVSDPLKTTILATVWDEDTWDSDDFIGRASVPVASIMDGEEHSNWLKLQPRDEDDEFLGDVRLSVRVDPAEDLLRVHVLEARNLAAKDSNGFSDPFVKIRHMSERKKTKVVKKNLNPYFNEKFQFKLGDIRQPLRVEVWDWDLVGTNDLIGICTVNLDEQMPETFNDRWYPLKSSAETVHTVRSVEEGTDLGSIRLKLRYTELRVLPTTAYRPLLELLLEEDLEVAMALSKCVPEIEAMAKNLIAIFGANSDETRFIKALTAYEISKTDNPDIIFRGNSGVTKAVDAYMKQIGKNYLHETLFTHIQKIFELKKPLEIDDARLEKGESSKKNLQKLTALCDDLISVIFGAADAMPPGMRVVFGHIRNQVMTKYTQEQIRTVQYTAISGFVFLRYFAPAILSPVLFDLSEVHAPQNTERTLKLIAKVIQNLANVCPFGEKEPFMKQLNPFIDNRMDEMKGYLNHISSETPEVPKARNPRIFLDKELAMCHSFITRHYDRLQQADETGSVMAKLKPVIDELKRAEEFYHDAAIQAI